MTQAFSLGYNRANLMHAINMVLVSLFSGAAIRYRTTFAPFISFLSYSDVLVTFIGILE